MGKSEQMMMHKLFGDNYEKAATHFDSLRDGDELLFKRLKYQGLVNGDFGSSLFMQQYIGLI